MKAAATLALLALLAALAAAGVRATPPDGADPPPPACLAPSLLCDGGATCVNETALCDGACDCADGADELRCPGVDLNATVPVALPACVPCPAFQCRASGLCLLDESRRCDGNDDCGDNSDEEECPPAGPFCESDVAVCQHLTFDDLPAGTVVTDQYSGRGVARIWHEINEGRRGGTGQEQRDIMIFDSENPTGFDSDLGSPNRFCPGGGGPGRGSGGRPGAAGENCQHHYGVLIISEDNDATDPDDSAYGGNIVFDFAEPVDVESLGILDIDDDGLDYIEYTTAGGGEPVRQTVPGVGNNGYQRVVVNATAVTQLKFRIWGSGSVTDLQFCPTSSPDFSDLRCLARVDEVYVRPTSVNTYGEFASAFAPDRVEISDAGCAACIELVTEPCVPSAAAAAGGRALSKSRAAASPMTVSCDKRAAGGGAEPQTPRECHVTCPASAGPQAKGGRMVPQTPAECHGEPECVYMPAVSGEMWGKDPFLYGDVVFTTQPEARSGVVSSVFTFHGTSTAESPVYEIIASFPGEATRTLVTNVQVWPQGDAAPLNHYRYVSLPFAWDEAPHTYRIVWRPTYIEWWADGALLRRLNAGGAAPVPDVAGRIMAHSWAVSDNAVVDTFRAVTGDFDADDLAPHRFCLECLQWHKDDGDECPEPPGGACDAAGGAVNGTCACPSVGEVAAAPGVRALYSRQHQSLTLEAAVPYHPNTRPLLGLVPAHADGTAALDELVGAWACAGEGGDPLQGCLASGPLAFPFELTSPSAARASVRCGLHNDLFPAFNPASPWFFRPHPDEPECKVLATLTVPFDAFLACDGAGAELVPTSDGSLRLKGNFYAALLKPSMRHGTPGFEANCTATVVSRSVLPFELRLSPDVAETVMTGVDAVHAAPAAPKARAAPEPAATGPVRLSASAAYATVDGELVMSVSLLQLSGPAVSSVTSVGGGLAPHESTDASWTFVGAPSSQRFQTFRVVTADGADELVQVSFSLAAEAGRNVEDVDASSAPVAAGSSALLTSRMTVMLAVLGVLTVFAVAAATARARSRRAPGLNASWCGASAREPEPAVAAAVAAARASPRRRVRRSPRKNHTEAALAARGLDLDVLSSASSSSGSLASAGEGRAAVPQSSSSAALETVEPAAAAAAAANSNNNTHAHVMRAPVGHEQVYVDDLDGVSDGDSDACSVDTAFTDDSAVTAASSASAAGGPRQKRGPRRARSAARRKAKRSSSPAKEAARSMKRKGKARRPALERPGL